MSTQMVRKANLKSLTEDERWVINQEAALIEKLVRRREQLGLRQADLGSIVGMKQSAIARFERSANIPKFDTIMKIAKGLGMKISVTPVD